MRQLSDYLERISMGLCASVFTLLTVVLPEPVFTNIQFRPLPRTDTLPPIIETESLVIHYLSVVETARLDALFEAGDAREKPILVKQKSQPMQKPTDQQPSAEQLNESVEFPRPPTPQVIPQVPSTPTNLDLKRE